MQQNKCGNSDLKFSKLGMGCWAFGGGEYWGNQNQDEVNQLVHRAFELGINYFDTAETYNEGRSEESLGLAIKGLPRDQIIIGTKISPTNTYPNTLVENCEASLRRLDVEYIDLYMIHWPINVQSIRHFTNDEKVINNPPMISDALETLNKLQNQGEIDYIGVSNFGVPRLEEILSFTNAIVVNELPYSLLTRAIEYDILPYCQNQRITIIGYMALLQGILADIYPTLYDVPIWQRRTRHFKANGCELCRHGEEGAEEETNQALIDIRTIAKEHGMTMAEIAIKWVVANSNITCTLVGSRNQKELEVNIKAANEPLAEGIVEKLNKITQPLMEKLGKSFDYYESTVNDRT